MVLSDRCTLQQAEQGRRVRPAAAAVAAAAASSASSAASSSSSAAAAAAAAAASEAALDARRLERGGEEGSEGCGEG